MSVHFLKTWPTEFAAVKAGEKTFEMRKNDRVPPYAKGDVVVLREYVPLRDGAGHLIAPKESPTSVTSTARGGDYVDSGWLVYRVGYVEQSKCLPSGWCGFSLEKATSKDKKNAVDASMGGTASK